MATNDNVSAHMPIGLHQSKSVIGPEHLTTHKLRALDEQQDARSDTDGSPNFKRSFSHRYGSAKHFSGAQSGILGSPRHGGTRYSNIYRSQLLTGSGGNGMRMQNVFLANHRSRMSSELAAQAESKFFAMMEMMTSASREASSFKEYWLSLMEDRMNFDREREDLVGQIHEITKKLETVEIKYGTSDGRSHEIPAHAHEIERLRNLIVEANDAKVEHEKNTSDRESELVRVTKELRDLHINLSSSESSHDSLKRENESLRLQLRDSQSAHADAVHLSEQQRNENKSLARDNSELRSQVQELTADLGTLRTTNAQLTEASRHTEQTNRDLFHERDRVQHDLKRMTDKDNETHSQLLKLTEEQQSLQRDNRRVHETLRTIESQRDDLAINVERLDSNLKDKISRLSDAETATTDTRQQLAQSKRETMHANEKVISQATDISGLQSQLSNLKERLQQLTIERDNANDEVISERRNVSDITRQMTNMKNLTISTESTISTLRADKSALQGTISDLESSREDYRQKHLTSSKEIDSLKKRYHDAVFQQEEMKRSRDATRGEFETFRIETETNTTLSNTYLVEIEELRQEIESLGTQLTAARAERGIAVDARHRADAERDEHIQLWENKCREFADREELNRAERAQLALEYSRQSEGQRNFSSTQTVLTSGNFGHTKHFEDGMSADQ